MSAPQVTPTGVVDDFVRAMDAVAEYVTVLDDVYQFKNADFAEALKAYEGNLQPDTLGDGAVRYYRVLDEVRIILGRIEERHLGDESQLPQKAKDFIKARMDRVRKRADRLETGFKPWERDCLGLLSVLSVAGSFAIPILGQDKSLLVQRTATNVRNATLLFDAVYSKLGSPDRWLDMFTQRILVPAPALLLYATTLHNQIFYHDPRYSMINLSLSAISVSVAIGKSAYPMIKESLEIRQVLKLLSSTDGEERAAYDNATAALAPDLNSLRDFKKKTQRLRENLALSATGRDAHNTLTGELNAVIDLILAMIDRARSKADNPDLMKKNGIVVLGGLVVITAIAASVHNEATLSQNIVWGVYYIWRLGVSAATSKHSKEDTLHMFCQAGAIVLFLLPTLYRDLLQHGPDAMNDFTRRTIALTLTTGVNGTIIHYFGPRGVPIVKSVMRLLGGICRPKASNDEEATIAMSRLNLGGPAVTVVEEIDDRRAASEETRPALVETFEEKVMETEALHVGIVEAINAEEKKCEETERVPPADPVEALLSAMDDYEQKALRHAGKQASPLGAGDPGSAAAALNALGRKKAAGVRKENPLVDFASALDIFKDVGFLGRGNESGQYDAIQSMIPSLIDDERLLRFGAMFSWWIAVNQSGGSVG